MFHNSQAKGFTITFDNGWTASVQWGHSNYCQNKDLGEHPVPYITKGDEAYFLPQESADAEIAAWAGSARTAPWYVFETYEGGYNEVVKGWVKPNEVLAFLNEIANKPKVSE